MSGRNKSGRGTSHQCNRGADCVGYREKGSAYLVTKAGRICRPCLAEGNTANDVNVPPRFKRQVVPATPRAQETSRWD